MDFRDQVISRYRCLLQDKIDAFRSMIAALAEDSRNDAKGSAGDKHETALSMMHLEQEKINRKLAEFLEQKIVLDRIAAQPPGGTIALGSLVTANGICLFISTALPKLSVGGVSVIALSPSSPLGAKLMGNAVGFSFEISGSAYQIEAVL